MSESAPYRRAAAIAAGSGTVFVLLLGLLVRLDVIALGVDGEWMEEVLEVRGPVWETVSLVFDFLGGGWFAIWLVPCGVAIVLIVGHRPWAALVFLLTSGVSALIVYALKILYGRLRPEDILIEIDSGSYPSGHTANAATIAVLAVILIPRWWVAVAGAAYVVLMALSRTYLGAHWVSDTVGGAVLGASVALGAWAVFAGRLHSERRSPAATVGS